MCCDVGVVTTTEQVMLAAQTVIKAPLRPPVDATDERIAAYHQELVTWERLRALAAKAAVDAHAKEVVYGSPLLEGYITKKSGGRPEPVLAPLFTPSAGHVADGGQLTGALHEVANASGRFLEYESLLERDTLT